MEQTNITKHISKYLKKWPLFAIGLVTCLAAVFLYLRYKAETQYEITSTLLVKNQDAGQGSVKSQNIKDLGLIKSNTNVEDEIGILRSTGLMEKVITDRSLNINYYIEGKVRDVEIYGEDVPIEILVDETATDLVYDLPIYITFINDTEYELETTVKNESYKTQHTYGRSCYRTLWNFYH
ncbi:hypothetical protein ACU8V7_15225 [Zobellia nedashkovskayae]